MTRSNMSDRKARMDQQNAKRVLLTSNADDVSRGIAVTLANHGCRLVLVGDEAAVDAAVGRAWRCFGAGAGLDALVNCYSYQGEVQDCLNISEDEYKKTIKVNVTTPWFLIKAIAKRFRIQNQLSAMELGKHKISVNAVCRGLHLHDKFPLSVGGAKAEKASGEVMPLQRWLDPEKDLASMVLYVVGDESRYMTGTTIYVDGAQSIVRMRSLM